MIKSTTCLHTSQFIVGQLQINVWKEELDVRLCFCIAAAPQLAKTVLQWEYFTGVGEVLFRGALSESQKGLEVIS